MYKEYVESVEQKTREKVNSNGISINQINQKTISEL